MLRRQRILLAIIEESNGKLSPTQLVKLAFLLRHEYGLQNDRTYYDFVPYKYGPFSFAMYRELASLTNYGYIVHDEKSVRLAKSTKQLSKDAVSRLSSDVRNQIASLLRKYGGHTQKALIGSVYKKYPWYATRSELKELVPSNVPQLTTADIAIYTIGYEGKSIDGFFNGLLQFGIRNIADVRANPVSRKYGFAKRSLSEIATKLGLGYYHLPKLGIPSSERTELNDLSSYKRLLNKYERQIIPKNEQQIAALVEILRNQPSALLCMEKDYNCCHRSRLASACSLASGMPVVHLN